MHIHQSAQHGGAASEAAQRTFTLPSGGVAAVRTPRARDLEKAYMIVGQGGATNTTALLLAVFSITGTIDGARVTYEEVQDLPMADAFEIIGGIGWFMGNAASPAREASSNSLGSPAGDSASSES